jgi:hypothetical protein
VSELRSPYPYFDGKRPVADVAWRAFGRDVPNFVDVAFGSNSFLLARPGGAGKIETINDADRMVSNFWRAVSADPWSTAEWCDRPVNEADMHAIHVWLVQQLQTGAEFRERMHQDPEYFDTKIAGLWVWGMCCWIGGGWCVEPQNHKHPKLDGIGKGVHSQFGNPGGHGFPRPNLNGGQGVHSLSVKLPHLAVKADGACAGRGVTSDAAVRAYSPGRRPSLAAERGVHLPSLGNDRGVHGVSTTPGTFLHALQELSVPDAPPAFEWFRALMLRMRRVRVACGDWRRVLGDSVLGKGKNVGGRRPCAVALDPPYSHDLRNVHLYGEDSATIAVDMREWALEHGDDPDLRICLAGYFEEHADHMPASWTVHRWTGRRGYAAEGNENRKQETLWFSPHCLPLEQQRSLFSGVSNA